MDSPSLETLEQHAYFSVVRALFACRRLQTFENELLLTDLQEALNISEQERLAYLQQVEQDAEAAHLATLPGTDELQPATAAAADAFLPMPSVISTLPQSPFLPHVPATRSGPSKKGKSKKAASTTGGSWKPSNAKKSNKGSLKSSGKVSAAHNEFEKAQMELDRLNVREREIFEALLEMGVEDEDPELNEVQRNLLSWYRLDVRQREIDGELFG